MSSLKEIEAQLKEDLQNEDSKEIMGISRDIYNTSNIISYPIELFKHKFYYPFRALIHYNVDTIALASKIKHGKVTSSTYRDWLSIAAMDTNKVALTTKENGVEKIVVVLPALVNIIPLREGKNITDTGINSLLLRASTSNNQKDQYFSLMLVRKSLDNNFEFNKNKLLTIESQWNDALNKVDEWFGRDPNKELEKLRVEIENLGYNIKEVKYADNNGKGKSKTNLDDELDAFDF